jgi:polyketide synthase PksN
MWALVRYAAGSQPGDKIGKLDIDMCDEEGKICVRMKGFSFRVLADKTGAVESPAAPETTGTVMYRPVWTGREINGEAAAPAYARHLVILCEPEEKWKSGNKHEDRTPPLNVVDLQSPQEEIGQRFQDYALRIFREIRDLLKDKDKPQGKILFQVVVANEGDGQLFTGLAALLKTARLEHPDFIGQLLEVNPAEDWQDLAAKLAENSHSPIDTQIRYQEGKRLVVNWEEVESGRAGVKHPHPWKDRGIYLFTGGAGGLGLLFAREIARQVKGAVLIMADNVLPDEERQAQFKEFAVLGDEPGDDKIRVEFKQVDVRQQEAVISLIQQVQREFGDLQGIIHGAGMIRDNFITRKTEEELVNVLAPKVPGLVNLDEASKDLPLDFFIFFSSLAGCLGNIGQVDYAVANAFMDAYAGYRNRLVASEQRRGQTLSINWPLWREGGMRVDEKTVKLLKQSTGIVPMQTSTGMRAFYLGLASGENQVMVIEGEPARFQALLRRARWVKEKEPQATPAKEQDLLREKAVAYFKKQLSSLIKLSEQQIKADDSLEDYGIDSIMVVELTNQLEQTFGPLSKTLFFEYQNLQDLTGYFLEHHREQLVELLGIEENKTAPGAIPDSQAAAAVTGSIKSLPTSRRRQRFATIRTDTPAEKLTGPLDIAVIGLSGRYPRARDIREFWKNLREGNDCITEIPKDRWDHSLYFDKDKNKPGKTYSKWGGFLEGVDQFDPLFFNISPREAEILDPQERLFLECVYETLEDAGYTRESLGKHQGNGLEGSVGVYVGVMYQEYQLYGAQQQILGKPVVLSGNPSSIANRISYYCNFHGPSMAIDTMCSSSLTAIHLACQNIRRGECDLAIAGGVNVSIHPNKYLLLGQGKFVSSKGRCESFGQGGDGYVPGEGVGAVLLKPLANAMADNDHIYGIIKATAVNHGGKTYGYTVPNPNAQANVIGRALKEAGISPRTISYIEAHGTGTSLGDPIEITGLTKGFREHTADNRFCAIGSVKSNIGHCESAAGIAGVTKVLLQLWHGQLVPSLHSEVLNPNIDFSNTPFVVRQNLGEWKRPLVESDGTAREYPRRAGVSSFGAGGSNAHIILEEWPEAQEAGRGGLDLAGEQNRNPSLSGPYLAVFSARNEKQLYAYAEKMKDFLEETPAGMKDIAYTLQVGREAMKERLAVIVGSVKELREKLADFLAGRDDIQHLYRGRVIPNKETVAIFAEDEELHEALGKWMRRKKYWKLLDLWVKGLVFDWNMLYGDSVPRPHRIGLPTYPFARERCWVPGSAASVISPGTSPVTAAPIHPLLQQNRTDLPGKQFSTTFTGREFFLADHVIGKRRILPGAVYLEMARAAAQQAGPRQTGQEGIRLKNVVWIQPLVVKEEPVQVHIQLSPGSSRGEPASYEIYSEPGTAGTNPQVHSRGSVESSFSSEGDGTAGAGKNPTLDLSALQAQCDQGTLSASQCYQAFKTLGIDYGPGHRGIEKVYIGTGQVLAKLVLPSHLSDTLEQYVLHPALLDAALQASIGLIMVPGDTGSPGTAVPPLVLPFALQEIEISGSCTAVMWSLVRFSNDSRSENKIRKFDIDLYDKQGNICARLKQLSVSIQSSKTDSTRAVSLADSGAWGTLILQSLWKEQAVGHEAEAATPAYARHLVLLCEPEEKWNLGNPEVSQPGSEEAEKRNRAQLTPPFETIELRSRQAGMANRFQTYANQVFQEIKRILKDKPNDKVLVQVVVQNEGEQQLFTGLGGMLKTARVESSKLITQLIEIEPGEDEESLREKLLRDSRSPGDNRIRYQGGKRWIAQWNELEASPGEAGNRQPWKDRGIYLITGGTGGLGLLFAREIVRHVKNTTLILTGRSPSDEEKQARLKELQALVTGTRVEYRQVDVTQKKAVVQLMQSIREGYGRLDGIIHSAGVIRDNFILKKTKVELQEVLAPKVKGLVNLDQASKDLDLDLFVLFSSVSGALGNVGQADYAAANAFMDAYAGYRNALAASKQRQGQTLSINWPLWKEGGMRVDQETEKMLKHTTGTIAMQTSTGIRAFYQALASGKDQVMVLEGHLAKIKQKLLPTSITAPTASTASPPGEISASASVTAIDTGNLLEKVQDALKHFLSGILKVSIADIDGDADLIEYGFDSITISEFVNKLNQDYELELTPIIFFDYPTLNSFAEFLVEEHQAAFAVRLAPYCSSQPK